MYTKIQHIRHCRISKQAKARLIEATYAAFVKSSRGQRVAKQLKAIKTGVISSHVIDKIQPRGKSGTLNAHIYMHQHVGDLLEGRANTDTLSLLHSWMGHMLYCCIQRTKGYKRGHIERAWLDHSIRALCAGRRAVFSAWQRELRIGKVGLAGPEIAPFKDGCTEAFFVAEKISKSELRAAFKFSDDKAARQGLIVKRDNNF